MAIKKSELYSSLWASCDELRGGMDASQYKDYVLGLLFIKYVSDKYAGKPFPEIIVPEGASFKDMIALKGTPDIGDQINKKIVAPLTAANQLLSQSDFPDFNDPVKLGDGKERQDRLTNLIGIFENKSLDFSRNRAEGDDILGDAYEYLMRHFATESGKSKGQFYTPAEVSRIIARIIGIHNTRVTSSTTAYDPTCGSGSLLLKVGEEAGKDITLYGQEKDATTSGLARMNMILHHKAGALIAQGNTLTDPKFKTDDVLKTFDFSVANPPFSDKRWSTGLDPLNDPYDRFEGFGIPPAKQGDYAYLLHIVRSLKSNGKGACILPHGVLFRGNAEAEIRRNLFRKGYIKGIIGLPPNLFYGTGIPACIVVIDKDDAHARKGIFIIDASSDFAKDGPKNRLREQDIHRIVDVFNNRSEIPKYSRMVSFEEIEKNEFNLNIPRYIDSQRAEDIQDIDGHLRGGIPVRDIDALDNYWNVCPKLRSSLFTENRPGYVDLAVQKSDIRASIYGHPEFAGFISLMNDHFNIWKERVSGELKFLDTDCRPKEEIVDLSEGLLAHYKGKPLIDAYDVYQHLMDYWAETMQDDLYFIAADGWKAETYRIIHTNKKGKEVDKGWICDLVPKELIVNRYFASEQEAIKKQESKLDDLISRLTDLEEEHGSDGGALSSVGSRNDALKARQEVTIALLESTDRESFNLYTKSLFEQECYRTRLRELESDPRIQGLANAKGRITQAAVKLRLQETNDSDERDLISLYQKTAEGVKETGEAARGFLILGSSKVRSRHNSEPEHDDFRELRLLDEYLEIVDEISTLKRYLTEAENHLDAIVFAKYPALNEAEIKMLVVDDKWLLALQEAFHGDMTRISQVLNKRVIELAERYETPLPQISEQLIRLEVKTDAHVETMRQQLLTGQKRLPGFDDRWKLQRLGELGSFLKGRGVKKDQAQSGNLPCIRYGEIYTIHNNYIRGFQSWISPDVAKDAVRLKFGDILFAGSGETKEEIGKSVAFLDKVEAYAGGDIIILRTEKADPLFLGYYLNTVPIRHQKASRGQGDAVVHISATSLAEIQGNFPALPEQVAIGNVLRNLDNEIEQLEEKFVKIQHIKLGMMQALMTGDTALIQPSSNVISFPEKVEIMTNPVPGHNREFDDAVVIAVLAKQFGSEEWPLSRFRYTKLSYLVRRHLKQDTSGYLKKAAGPYNPKTRYQTEATIERKKYVTKRNNGTYTGFIASENIPEAIGYFEKWYGNGPLNWLEQFRRVSSGNLELLTTVDMSICELHKSGSAITVENVKDLIQSETEWKAKLQKDEFSDNRIALAIKESIQLFGP